jgi:tetratricopeptide (TPR) repeat protein
MATIPEALAIAIQHHQAGRLQAAEQIYRQILAVQPNHADALNLLGVLAYQAGKHEVAVEYLRRAIGLNGTMPAFHNNLGNVLKDQGKLDEAVACYRRAMELEPDNALARNNLGLALGVQGNRDEAVACYRRALELKPGFAEAHDNLGSALKQQGKLDEAVACYRRALELRPDFAEAHDNLGSALRYQGKLDEVAACHRRALELKPGFAEAHNNLGSTLKQQGKLDEAVACYRRAVELKPHLAEAIYNLSVALNEQGNAGDAVACFRRAVELKPELTDVHYNLGNAFKDQGRFDEAAACYRQVLQFKPDFAEVHNNLGAVFADQAKLDEAVACFHRSLELKWDNAQAHSNLGAALREQGKLDEAIACFRRAVELKPDFAEVHWNLALAWLLVGNWQHGWPQYEWRRRTKDASPRDFSQPLWDGEPLAAKTILLYAEQGLGDTIQFVRYAAVVKRFAATVVVECQKPLLGLLEGCPGVDHLVAQGDSLPAFDVQAPLLSVPGILKTSVETIPARIPYLFAKPVILERWRHRLIGLDGFKIGIVWQGNPAYRGDRSRSIPLRCFGPLAAIPGVRLVSLQKGAGTEQLAEVRDLFPVTELGSRLEDFLDTAAVMRSLDLVIACDTAVAHLAGALGIPAWVALPLAADWRWMLDRSDSPWYPTMQLFRQRDRGNWQGVFEEIKEALCRRLSSSKADGAIL